jgi:hypothetical protein
MATMASGDDFPLGRFFLSPADSVRHVGVCSFPPTAAPLNWEHPMADDSELTDEERTAVNHAWRNLIEDKAHGGKLHYTMPDVRGMAPPGSFRIPKDVFAALGDGDLKLGGAIIHQMFGIEDDPADPTRIHGDVVRIIGHGSLAKGQEVLHRFVQMVRKQSRDGVTLEHDGLQHEDGHHGWRVRQ